MAPTCETAGSTAVLTCANGCGKTEGGDAVAALGHDMQETTAAVAPTCETAGSTAVLTCANGCGKTEGGDEVAAKGHGHTDGFDYTDLKNGYHKVTCADCDVTTVENEVHDFGYDAENHKCICGAASSDTATVEVNLYLKAVDANGAVIDDELDALLNDSAWVGTEYLGYENPYTVNIGENTLSSWDYYPEGYNCPEEDITFTVDKDGNLTITSSNATAEKVGDTWYIVVTLNEDTSIDLYLGGIGMESGDYLAVGAKAVTDTKPTAGGYAYYKDGTLTLHNYTFEGEGFSYDGDFNALRASGDLNVILEGENSLICETESDGGTKAMRVAGNLTVSGTGSLNVTGDTYGLYVAGELTMNSGKLTVKGGTWYGIRCSEDMVVNGGTLSAEGFTGIEIPYSSMTVNGGTVTAIGEKYGVDVCEDLTVKGGVLNASATEEDSSAIYTDDGKITITGGKVSAICPDELAYSWGVRAGNGMEVTGGKLTASGAEDGIYVDGDVTISGGTVEVLAGGLWADTWDPNVPGTITLTNVEIVEPEGGKIGEVYDEEYGWYYAAIVNADDTEAEAFVITDGEETETVYTITWTVDGETYATATVNHGDTITAPETDPTKGEENEYRFKGWEGFTEGMTASGDQTFTAKFVELYSVSYSLGVSGGYVGYFEEGETIDYNNLPAVDIDDTETVEKIVKGVAWVTLDGSEKPVVMPAEDIVLRLQSNRTGWFIHGSFEGEIYGIYYVKNNVPIEEEGWYELPADHTDLDGDTAWYYIKKTTITIESMDPADEDGLTELTDYFRVEGITRVHYPTVTVDGNTYAADAESVAYAESKGETFLDKDSGLFIFGEDGKFQSAQNGMLTYLDATRWATNGLIEWHPGMQKVEDDYYYFIGDVDIGGNIMATGDVYISRNTTKRDVTIGGVYTFGEDGKLCEYDGITEVNGKLRYYENAQLMLGKGLVKIAEGKYIYVRSNGELVVGKEYWVPANSYGIEEGIYAFDENGFIIIPEPEVLKNGVYNEDGKWIYYIEGAKQYNAGLIVLPAGTNWYDAEAKIVKTADGVSYVYVRSNAQLATGTYWITNTNDAMAVGKYEFDEYGLIQTQMNGIYYENGGLYFYENNQIKYNAGLMQYTGTSSEEVVYNNDWIYVRSNGQLAIGTYWITNTNDKMDSGKYEFDENGKMLVEAGKDGIVEENGKLYYYVDGVKQVGTGLVQLSDGSYIYVKTTGELATGTYWITNNNGMLTQGQYDFGTDGKLYI